MANNSIGAYAQGGSNDIGAYEYAPPAATTTPKALTYTAGATVAFSTAYVMTESFAYTGGGSVSSGQVYVVGDGGLLARMAHTLRSFFNYKWNRRGGRR